ncbi:DMT family transporter [Rhizobium sp. LjRoot98]|uniref:DMT family transporter n=1 Tax=Rhizobium sp. LjRoot98 TaxID=3342345 RepID=UPI003ECFAD17
MWQNSVMTQTIKLPTQTTLLPALAVAGTIISWSASFAAIGISLRELEPLPMASVRFALASFLALGWLLWQRQFRFPTRDLFVILICGVLGIAAYNMLLNLGQASVSAGAASFIVNTQPLFMVGLAVVFLKERFNAWAWCGALLALSGVAVIASGQPGGLVFGAGTILIVGAAASAATYSVLQRPLLARHNPLSVTAAVVLAGTVALCPWLPAGLEQLAAASQATVGAVVFLAVAPAAIGQSCWTYALKHFGAARAGQFLYLIPPCAMFFAWAGLGETPETRTLLGGALALGGVLAVNTLGRR